MTIIKNDFPILEHDSTPTSIIANAKVFPHNFPQKAVFAFLRDEVPKFAASHQAITLEELHTATKIYSIYQVEISGKKICLCQAPVGAAAATQIMDYLIQHGVREIISVGSCGNLIAMSENEFIIPTVALRDEGCSYHYLPPARDIKINNIAVTTIKRALNLSNLNYNETKTWSTDGFFRETKDMIDYRVAEGCQVVEMECAALAACAEFYHIIWGELLFTADTLADPENYQERGFGHDSKALALELAIAAVNII